MDLGVGLVPTGEWECMECGYIEVGVEAKRPGVCPDCGAPSQALEFFRFVDDDEENRVDLLVDDEASADETPPL